MIDIDLLLAWGATYKKVNRNEIIFYEGATANFYHQLVQGRVRWVSIDEHGKEFIHMMVEDGESFGEIPLFDNEPYAATAVADEDSLLIRLHKSHFLALIHENHSLHFDFSRLLAQRLRFRFLLVKELAMHSPEHKISSLLNYFKERNRHTCPDSNMVKLTRQQIADMTGLRVETVIRTIRYLRSSGKVSIEKGKVYCSNDSLSLNR
ncbi:MAG: Crp/Fnr family transcriptional regulator [Chitinophagales bacterium]